VRERASAASLAAVASTAMNTESQIFNFMKYAR
jgi:predicted peroxiredoxin